MVCNTAMPTKPTNEPRHALNAVCPYFTMFPLAFPFRALKGASTRSIVLDPFCGRGTSNYAARYLGLSTYGIDTSPVAVAIAKAKLAVSSKEEVIDLAKKLLAKPSPDPNPAGEFWMAAFHPLTLEQICRLRAGLAYRHSDAANLLRGIALGCLHGPLSKDPAQTGYFSNQMPRTFASKPGYSVRFWQSRGMVPREIDVLHPIERKLDRILAEHIPALSEPGQIRRGDSTSARSYDHVPDRITHVITSPPYYGLTTYVQDQWLRNWFVGGPENIEYAGGVQLSHRSPEQFSKTLARVWDHCGDRLVSSGKMVIRFGSIRSRDREPLDILRRSLALSRHQWRIVHSMNVGTAKAGKRQADAMGTTTDPTHEYDVTVRLS